MIDSVFATGLLDYGNTINTWKSWAASNNGQLMVRSLDFLKQAGKDPWHSFLECLDVGREKSVDRDSGLKAMLRVASETSKNKRISLESILLLRHLHNNYGREVFNVFMSDLPGWFPLPGQMAYLTNAQRALVMAQVSRTNAMAADLMPNCTFEDLKLEDDPCLSGSSLAIWRDLESKVVDSYEEKALHWLANIAMAGASVLDKST